MTTATRYGNVMLRVALYASGVEDQCNQLNLLCIVHNLGVLD